MSAASRYHREVEIVITLPFGVGVIGSGLTLLGPYRDRYPGDTGQSKRSEVDISVCVARTE